ncbi:MAG: AAA family ATPase [Magnetococcales bacterium]|nr:AAA family ATPase [Magnetococcales bacterium]
MYLKHFGLKRQPFSNLPDLSLFYEGGRRGEVVEAIIYAILGGEGILKVVGEVGSGKTMLCHYLMAQLPPEVEVVYLVNPSLSPENIFHAIATELKLSPPDNADRLHVMHMIQDYLVQRYSENCQVVVCIDEAQGMPIETLEEIRLLSNLETQRQKLLQIVLFGQPELDVNLDGYGIRQLKDRIAHSFYLEPLDKSDILQYLIVRMRATGLSGEGVFHPRAAKLVAKEAQGLIRRTNTLANKSLMAAYVERANQVTVKHVRTAMEDCDFLRSERSVKKSIGWNWYSAMAAGLVAVGIGFAGLGAYNMFSTDGITQAHASAAPEMSTEKRIEHTAVEEKTPMMNQSERIARVEKTKSQFFEQRVKKGHTLRMAVFLAAPRTHLPGWNPRQESAVEMN